LHRCTNKRSQRPGQHAGPEPLSAPDRPRVGTRRGRPLDRRRNGPARQLARPYRTQRQLRYIPRRDGRGTSFSGPSSPARAQAIQSGAQEVFCPHWLDRSGAPAVRARSTDPGALWLRTISKLAKSTSAAPTSAHCAITRASLTLRCPTARARHSRPCWPPSPTIVERSPGCIALGSTSPGPPRRGRLATPRAGSSGGARGALRSA